MLKFFPGSFQIYNCFGMSSLNLGGFGFGTDESNNSFPWFGKFSSLEFMYHICVINLTCFVCNHQVPYGTNFNNRFLNRVSDIDKDQSPEENTGPPRLMTVSLVFHTCFEETRPHKCVHFVLSYLTFQCIINAFRGLPTSEDLRKTYFWESRRVGLKERSRLVAEKRQYRMDRLWHVQWYGDIEILTFSKTGPNQVERHHAFAMLQGNRFLWWRSLTDFDDGIDMLGYVCLRGHSGLATPSPMEVRHLSPDDLQRLVCIFGRGKDKQERLTLTTDSTRSKQHLEQLIEVEMVNKLD
jgi:hypothetical protein